MQFFNVPNTNYRATPASTGIDSSKFDKYFDDGYQKQVLCAAHPLCMSPLPLDSNNTPHRCVGCGLHIHCEMFCGEFWTKLKIFTPQLPEYGHNRITSGEFVPSDTSVLCYRCIQYTEHQQKLPANNSNPSPSTTDYAKPTLVDVLEKGTTIDENLWFDWLQDDGFTVPKAAKQQDQGGKGKRSQKKKDDDKPKKPKHISHGNKLHPKLYTMAIEVVKAAHAMDVNFFPRLPDSSTKNISKTYHSIGEWIASRRKLYKRADIHNMGAGMEWVMPIINAELYRATTHFYVLNQEDVFTHVFEKFGPKDLQFGHIIAERELCSFGSIVGTVYQLNHF